MAQKQFHDIQVDYDIEAGRDKNLLVKDRYTNSVSAAAAKFPRWYERLKATMTQAEADDALMNDTTVTAAYMNAYTLGHAHAINAPMLSSSAVIRFPWGEFWVTRQLPIPVGQVTGAGPSWGGTSMASTLLSPYHEKWRGDMKYRNVFVSQVRGVSGNSGYLENSFVDGFNLEGRCDYEGKQWYDPTYESSGIYMAGAGELSRHGMSLGLRGAHFNNYAYVWNKATPGEIGHISVFKNNEGGVGVLNCALGTMRIGVVSGDENPYLVRCVRDVQGGDEGAMLDVSLAKLEGGTNPEDVLAWPHKGEMLLDFRGQGGVNFHTVQCATTYYVNYGLVQVHPAIAAYGAQNASIKIGLLKQNRNGRAAFERSFLDTFNGKSFDIPGIFDPEMDVNYSSKGGGTVKINGNIAASKSYPQADRLGYITHTDTRAFDPIAGNPKFYFTGPPTWGTTPPPTGCTWVLGTPGAWSACVNNSQSRTTPYVSSVAGCTPTTPKPADLVETQACGTIPPPSGNVIGTLTNVNVGPNGQTLPAAWNGVKKLVIEGFRVSSVGGYIITNAQGGVKIGGNGSVYYSVIGVGNPETYYPSGKVKANTTVDLTIDLGTARDFTHLGRPAGGGQAWTATKVTASS